VQPLPASRILRGREVMLGVAKKKAAKKKKK
jgi:hypothetical protein